MLKRSADRVYQPTLTEKLAFGERAERVFDKRNLESSGNMPWRQLEERDDGSYYDDINVPSKSLYHFTDTEDSPNLKKDRAMIRRISAEQAKSKERPKKKVLGVKIVGKY